MDWIIYGANGYTGELHAAILIGQQLGSIKGR